MHGIQCENRKHRNPSDNNKIEKSASENKNNDEQEKSLRKEEIRT